MSQEYADWSLENIRRLAVDRTKVCLKCPKFSKMTKTCQACGCFVPAKVLIPGIHCPDDKW